MIPAVALRVLNHLLDQTPGAAGKLAAHAGSRARLMLGSVSLSFTISDAGRLAESSGDGHAVTLRLPADTAWRLPLQGESALREVRVEGDAALAETLGGVLRSLRWDAAEDLSGWVGDVAAERLVGAVRSAVMTGNDLAARFIASSSEYVADEAQLLVRPADAASLGDDVDTLRDDVARLHKRLELLECRTAREAG